ncbi:MarR family winged helix-turn-helix transcriptional regulator [Gemella morbillorum]|uniref:MarR family winged helix-turn-helix transcriptional regulator n=1 Tax=Gemella morbillorum TaxID=29391 RepID=UPI001CABF450|nr:MarR family transcriptional regulator [Gemella morbillorum]MBF1212008.1 MarR family transcriptional regulator [Gemella morbillorum]
MNNEFKAVIGIMRASNLLIDDLKKTLKNYPINVTEFSVMEFLYSKGEKSIQEIRDRILLASGSATYVVDNLERKEYVRRIVNQNDRRVTYIKLTEAGKDLINDIFPTHKKNTKKIFNDLTNGELITLKEILKKIN